MSRVIRKIEISSTQKLCYLLRVLFTQEIIFVYTGCSRIRFVNSHKESIINSLMLQNFQLINFRPKMCIYNKKKIWQPCLGQGALRSSCRCLYFLRDEFILIRIKSMYPKQSYNLIIQLCKVLPMGFIHIYDGSFRYPNGCQLNSQSGLNLESI